MLQTVYLILFSGSAVIAAGLFGWVRSRADTRGRGEFLAVLGVDVIWTGSAGLALLFGGSPAAVPLTYVRGLGAIASVLAWYRFAVVYTSRSASIRSLPYAAVVVPGLLLCGTLVTNPAHSLYWSSFTARSQPFAYVTATPGPLALVALLWVYATIGLALYYLLTLFVKSRRRPSRAVAVLIGASVLASLPSAASLVGAVPLPAYNHTAMGAVPFVAAVSYVVFVQRGIDLRPVARDELLDEISDGYLALDRAGRVVDYNRVASRLLAADGDAAGRSLASLNRDLHEAVSRAPDGSGEVGGPAATPTEPAVGESMTDESPATGQSEASSVGESVEFSTTVGQQERTYLVSVEPLADGDRVVGRSLFLRDITDRKRYQEELRRQNHQLEQFAETVTHDLRNPLNVLEGRLSLAAEELATDESTTASDEAATRTDASESGSKPADASVAVDALAAADEHVAVARRMTDRMDEIIDDLRTLAEHGQSLDGTTQLSLRVAATDAWEAVETGDATLTVVADAEIRADRTRLLTIFENLFRNGVVHVGNDVAFRVGTTDDGFFIADDGPGIPDEHRSRVFEYGWTTDRDGTGLGLAIVATMAQAHGWEVGIDPDYDRGTRVCFSGVPVTPSRTAPDVTSD